MCVHVSTSDTYCLNLIHTPGSSSHQGIISACLPIAHSLFPLSLFPSVGKYLRHFDNHK